MRAGWLAPQPGPSEPQWAALYQRGGDTYVKILYLVKTLGLGDERTPRGKHLLEMARFYYGLSAKSEPQDVRVATSLGVVLATLGREAEAKKALGDAVLHASPREQAAAIATSRLAAGNVSAELIAQARPLLLEVEPGGLFLANAYTAIGSGQIGRLELDAAERRAEGIAPRLIALVIVGGAILLAGPIGLIVLLVRRRPGAAGELPTPPPGVPEAVEALVLWVLVAILASSILIRFAFAGKPIPGAVVVLPSLVAGCGAIAWVRFACRGARLGWDLRAPLGSIGWGLMAAGFLAPAAAVMEQFLQKTWQPVEHPLVPVFAAASGWESKAALVAAACLVIPVLEETLFRGILYRALRVWWSPVGAALASGLVFAVGHMSFVGLLPYLLIGVVLAGLYEKKRSLLAPAVCHAAFNAFNMVILFALFG
jgi:membrane protease YdiL (CAAX protease family)